MIAELASWFTANVPDCIGASPVGDGYRLDFSGAQRQATDEEILEANKAIKRNSVTAERERRERLGCAYAFPDVSGVIQTRDPVDYRNINGHVTGALLLQAQGVTDQVIPFRDSNDVTHMLTPTQMMAAGAAVLSRVTALYQAQWAIKDSIGQAATTEDLEAIDITAGWPE